MKQSRKTVLMSRKPWCLHARSIFEGYLDVITALFFLKGRMVPFKSTKPARCRLQSLAEPHVLYHPKHMCSGGMARRTHSCSVPCHLPSPPWLSNSEPHVPSHFRQRKEWYSLGKISNEFLPKLLWLSTNVWLLSRRLLREVSFFFLL